jgi:hypothetical protein
MLAAGALFALSSEPASAFNQPPLNFGLTDVLDGGPPGPGTYFSEYIQAYSSHAFRDQDGKRITGDPKVATLASVNQLVHVYPHKIGGANIGADLLVPLVSISTSGTFGNGGPAVTSNPDVMGDIIVGPFMQWFDSKLMGRPFVQRVELDLTLPTGGYDRKFMLNPGSNVFTVEPHYAFTWFLTPELSTSWRLHYTWSSENDDAFGGVKVKAGQAFHANYSCEYAFAKNLRGAVAGYYLKQITEDEVNGAKQDGTKEQVFAIGPAAHWIVSDQFSVGLKTAWEGFTENRPQGNRTTLRFTYKF